MAASKQVQARWRTTAAARAASAANSGMPSIPPNAIGSPTSHGRYGRLAEPGAAW
jgi:hypothetical protein